MGAGGSAAFGSSLERDWFIALEFDWRVKRFQVEPYTISYVHEGKAREYTPDCAAEFDDGAAQWVGVYEVKPRETLREEWLELRPKFKAALADCRAHGWRFHIVTERQIRTPYVQNAQFLRRFKNEPPQSMHAQALMYTLKALGPTTPQALIEATWYDNERQLGAIAELWRLVANRLIQAELIRPLTMASAIWLP